MDDINEIIRIIDEAKNNLGVVKVSLDDKPFLDKALVCLEDVTSRLRG